jgi:hypothetical protein
MQTDQRALRFLVGQAAGGGGVGLLTLLLLIVTNITGLAALLDAATDKAVATLMLMAAFAGTFAAAALATSLNDLPAD